VDKVKITPKKKVVKISIDRMQIEKPKKKKNKNKPKKQRRHQTPLPQTPHLLNTPRAC